MSGLPLFDTSPPIFIGDRIVRAADGWYSLLEIWKAAGSPKLKWPIAFVVSPGINEGDWHTPEGEKMPWGNENTARAYCRYLSATKPIPIRPDRDVYFIRCRVTKLIKVGVSDNIERRLATIRSHSPTPLALIGRIPAVGMEAERAIHGHFAHLRHHGEWFRPGRDLLAFIETEARTWRRSASRTPTEASDQPAERAECCESRPKPTTT